MTPHAFRQQIRSGEFCGTTAGVCGAYAQANLVILPSAAAAEFHRFCHANPKPCPLLAVSEPGQWSMPTLGRDVDIRRDLPAYNVYRDGRLCAEIRSLEALWQPDWVAFAIGCSFSFEQALLDEGIPLRHIEEQRNVPMYRTNIANNKVGPFGGNLVVSMRPMLPRDAIRAIQITSLFPSVHGAPVHLGDPQAIGIKDLSRPDYGDAVTVNDGEIPLFWACGVTPQEAIRHAGLPLVVTHRPGFMLVTDILNRSLAVL